MANLRTQEELFEGVRATFSCIDNTTLEGIDNRTRVRSLCEQSLRLHDSNRGIGHVAAVCVYPVHVHTAVDCLRHSDIRVASVAGGFPSGQVPLRVKIAEVRCALDDGADEIDMVINRGDMLEGNTKKVFDEIATIRKVAEGRTLKVILETGELVDNKLIAEASQLAIKAGADFIKTSTGKSTISATLGASEVMLREIKKYHDLTGIWVGFKAAGGISTPEEVLKYYLLYSSITGIKIPDKKNFRIGDSRLTSALFDYLVKEKRNN